MNKVTLLPCLGAMKRHARSRFHLLMPRNMEFFTCISELLHGKSLLLCSQGYWLLARLKVHVANRE
jgi:hypothetical protein